MKTNKEAILLTALQLFSKNGYDSVSVSEIAGELGIVKSALYRHFKSKNDIFESILQLMEETDFQQAEECDLPTASLKEAPEAYKSIRIENVIAFGKKTFSYWTEQEIPALFRKLLTLEQFRSEEMQQLYQQYLVSGPLIYLEDIFAGITENKKLARKLALDFYSPIYMLYTLYDCSDNKAVVNKMLSEHLDKFTIQSLTA